MNAPPVTINETNYHGWPHSLVISDGFVEAIVVPAAARVMQFRFIGDEAGTFWENRDLDGRQPNPDTGEWMNFGGDKCWPSPQSDWPATMGRYWPPPVAFDTMPAAADVDGEEITLVTTVDPDYGLRVVRRITLVAGRSAMTIRTRYRKIEGPPVKVAIWTITQLRDPQRVFALLPQPASTGHLNFPRGFGQMTGPEPWELQHHERMISLRRHPDEKLKIGTESESLLWMGEKCSLRISSARTPGEYPNGGSSAEIYTDSPDPYVELETTGALHTMHVGDLLEKTNTYQLSPRTTTDEVEEARKAFGLTERH